MSDKKPGLLSLALIPAVLTLGVSILRLVGELQGWDPLWFDNHAPQHEDQQLGLVGISWLVPIFGLYFGVRLRRLHGQPARPGKAALLLLIGGVVMAGGFFALIQAGLISMPDADNPQPPSGLPYILGVTGVSLLIMLIGAGRLAMLLLVYGLLARLPVVAITWFAVQNPDWDVHHSKLPVGVVLPEGASPLPFLITPQLTVWIAFTMMVGGLFGCLGATMTKSK
jgi:hypothetical protein